MTEVMKKIRQAGEISWFYFFFTWRTTLISLIWICAAWLTIETYLGLFQFHTWQDISEWLYTQRWILTSIGSIIYLFPANLSTIILSLSETPYNNFQLITQKFTLAQRAKKLLRSINDSKMA